MVDVNIKPKLGHIPLQDLKRRDIKKAWRELLENGHRFSGQGLSPKTIHNLHGVLSTALKWAKEEELVDTIETKGMPLPKLPDTEMLILKKDDSARLIESLEDHWLQPIVILALTTGMRLGELLGLHWQHVDIEEKTIQIKQSVSFTKEAGLFLKETKTASGRRAISISNLAAETLRKLQVRQSERALKLGSRKNDTPVFDSWNTTGEVGKHLASHIVSEHFRRHMKKLDIPRIRFHDLRHTHISQLLTDGWPITTVSKRAGHKSPRITLDTYAHAIPGSDSELMKTYDEEHLKNVITG